MENKNDIRWVQLSDLHIGCLENKWGDDNLRKELIYYLENDIGRIDFILVTGDIIHQGKYKDRENYNQAKDFLNILKEKFGKIIYCAGNHDYSRNETRYELLKKWQLLDDNIKKEKEQEYASKLCVDFEEFTKLCNEDSKDVSINTRSYVCKQIEGLNIIVLNTSTFSGQPILEQGEIVVENQNIKINDYQKLWIDENELPTFEQIDRQLPTVVIGHHPLYMFDKTPRNRLETFIKKLNAEYLCGHVHQTTKTNIGNVLQNSSGGIFEDSYNIPSFTYNILKKIKMKKFKKNIMNIKSSGGVKSI